MSVTSPKPAWQQGREFGQDVARGTAINNQTSFPKHKCPQGSARCLKSKFTPTSPGWKDDDDEERRPQRKDDDEGLEELQVAYVQPADCGQITVSSRPDSWLRLMPSSKGTTSSSTIYRYAMPHDPAQPLPSRLPEAVQSGPEEAASASRVPSASHGWHPPKPRLRLELRDLGHKMTKAFLDHVDPTRDVLELVDKVCLLLYSPTSLSDGRSGRKSEPHVPATRSVTLVLRDMEGVAYTTGLDLDDDHKEIHLSLSYISHVVSSAKASTEAASPTTELAAAPSATSSAVPFLQPQTTPILRTGAPTQDPVRHELLGVICHELVHCYQHNAKGSAPGGLIEGIADWVRLHAGYVPPHWRREAGDDWDAGYQKTGYFLDWLETKNGPGSISRLNEALRGMKYHEHDFWHDLFGRGVGQLWAEYCETLK